MEPTIYLFSFLGSVSVEAFILLAEQKYYTTLELLRSGVA